MGSYEFRADDSSSDLLEVSYLSLDEPDIEAVMFINDGHGGEEIDTFPISNETVRVD